MISRLVSNAWATAGGARGVDVRARRVDQVFDDRLVRGDECARHASGLAERADIDQPLRTQAQVFEHTMAVLAEHAKAVRVVDDDPCIVAFGDVQRASGAISPSMLKTLSVTISFSALVLAASSASSALVSPWG
jgi:hypothetical protein